MARRLGIFGGTFDPPHHGHLIVVSEACEALALDRVLLVPAAVPPHKPGGVVATAEQRLRMLRAAVAGDSRLVVDDLELRRAGPSYSVDTVRAIRAREADAELVFLLGIDQFRALESWREPGEIARMATFAVLSRDGETLSAPSPYGGVPVRVSRIDISATEIRKRIAEGRSVRYLVPEPVLGIIEREGIYRAC